MIQAVKGLKSKKQALLFDTSVEKVLPPENAYIRRINKILKPKIKRDSPLALDLFAGCGGLALGFEAQGFRTLGYEMDQACCDTYNENLHGECNKSFLTVNTEYPKADVIIGGPPCQPFSVRGKQKGLSDERNGFPAFINAVEKVQPKIWLFENVRGLLYKNKEYFEEVLNSLRDLGYFVEYKIVNAVEHEVPQNRQRVVVVGTKVEGVFKFPEAMESKITVGEALGELMLTTPPESRFLTPSMDEYIAKYEAASKCVMPRDLHPDRPSRTLTCRNLSGATSDMHRVKLPNGKRRRILVREAARLQSFPDWYEFEGNESSVFNQIGNAVAPMMAYHLAAEVQNYLNNA